MKTSTIIQLTDQLPLTCSRKGTCCFGNLVMLNPWELALIAQTKGLDADTFRDKFCVEGGARIHFNGAKDSKNRQACSLYDSEVGCSVHSGRPLSCRLYPLGRQKQKGENRYIYQGAQFPCLTDCAEVLDLPQVSVQEYIQGQGFEVFEQIQDEYFELMQNLADGAFALLFDSGLVEEGDTSTLTTWKKLSQMHPEDLVKYIGPKWVDSLMNPKLDEYLNLPLQFFQKHSDALTIELQANFGNLESLKEYSKASSLMMGLALYLARIVGADTKELGTHWIKIAQSHGAKS